MGSGMLAHGVVKNEQLLLLFRRQILNIVYGVDCAVFVESRNPLALFAQSAYEVCFADTFISPKVSKLRAASFLQLGNQTPVSGRVSDMVFLDDSNPLTGFMLIDTAICNLPSSS